MDEGALKVRLDKVKGDLEAIGQRLADDGGVPRESLEDFKRAVDDVRISAWAVLSADESEAEATGYASMVAQFRLGRTVELCERLLLDLEGGLIPPDHPGLREFRTVVERTLARVRGPLDTGK